MIKRTKTGRKGGWHLLLDFDGTITTLDADIAIAELALHDDRRARCHRIYEAFERLELSVLGYFEEYLELLELDPEAIARHALLVPVRPDVQDLVRFCRRRHVELTVVSEGLDLYLHPILEAQGLGDLAVSCNRAIHKGNGRYEVEPPADGTPCDRCLNCKGAHVRRSHASGYMVAVVGNGASDLCGAREADLVFARETLMSHCINEKIEAHGWTSFLDVVQVLDRRLGPERSASTMEA